MGCWVLRSAARASCRCFGFACVKVSSNRIMSAANRGRAATLRPADSAIWHGWQTGQAADGLQRRDEASTEASAGCLRRRLRRKMPRREPPVGITNDGHVAGHRSDGGARGAAGWWQQTKASTRFYEGGRARGRSRARRSSARSLPAPSELDSAAADLSARTPSLQMVELERHPTPLELLGDERQMVRAFIRIKRPEKASRSGRPPALRASSRRLSDSGGDQLASLDAAIKEQERTGTDRG